MSQIWEPIVEVTHHVPQERVQDRTPEQFVDVPVPRIVERADEVVRVTPRERVQNLTLEHIVDVPVPQIMKAAVEVVHAPQECVQSRTPEQIVDEPVRPVMEAAVEVVRNPPQRVQDRVRDQIVDVPVPHIKEDGLLLVPQERVHNRAAMTRLSWWTLWVPSRVSTSTICLDLEMSWCPRLRSKSRLSTLVGQGSFGKLLRRMLWSGSRIQQRLLEQNLELFKINAQKRVQRRFSEVEDLVVVSEDSRFLRERVAERLARIDALLAQVSEEEEEVGEEEIPEVQPSRFQGVFRPRRLCPNLLRGSRCHHGNRCIFAHAFHELADELRYVPGSTAEWRSVHCAEHHRHSTGVHRTLRCAPSRIRVAVRSCSGANKKILQSGFDVSLCAGCALLFVQNEL